jgi:predicted amino acid racemase
VVVSSSLESWREVGVDVRSVKKIHEIILYLSMGDAFAGESATGD